MPLLYVCAQKKPISLRDDEEALRRAKEDERARLARERFDEAYKAMKYSDKAKDMKEQVRYSTHAAGRQAGRPREAVQACAAGLGGALQRAPLRCLHGLLHDVPVHQHQPSLVSAQHACTRSEGLGAC